MYFLEKNSGFWSNIWPFARFSIEMWARKNNDFSGVCGVFAHFPTFFSYLNVIEKLKNNINGQKNVGF